MAIWFAAAAFAVVGLGKGALQNNAKRRQGNANLQAAIDQAEFYETKARATIRITTLEGGSIFREAGYLRAERGLQLAGRGIASTSSTAESLDRADSYEARKDYSKMLSNAYTKAAGLRAQGRMAINTAQKELDIIEDEREMDIFSGMLQGFGQGMSMGGG